LAIAGLIFMMGFVAWPAYNEVSETLSAKKRRQPVGTAVTNYFIIKNEENLEIR
jgi:hypothetical protein